MSHSAEPTTLSALNYLYMFVFSETRSERVLKFNGGNLDPTGTILTGGGGSGIGSCEVSIIAGRCDTSDVLGACLREVFVEISRG